MMAADTQDFDWRSAEDDPPCLGSFVELARATSREVDRFGLNDSEKKPLDRVYWHPMNWNLSGLFWRYCAVVNWLAADTPAVDRPPIDEDFWYVVLCQPQQELSVQWRLHELSLELYVPIIRRRVKTGRTGRNGQKVTRILPRPMFPGYGLVRRKGIDDLDKLRDIRGVRDVMKDENRKPVVLPHEAVLAIFRKQSQKHSEFHQEFSWRMRPRFKANDQVRIEAEGNVYDGHFATVENDNGKDRIALLLGAARIRHTLPADMVVAV